MPPTRRRPHLRDLRALREKFPSASTSAPSGFVDLQVNGFLGLNFSDPVLTTADIRTITRELVARGTIAYCPTLITSPLDVYRRNLPLIAAAMRDPEFGRHILGVHLEGPYISPAHGAVGAHYSEWVRRPNLMEFRQMLRWSDNSIRLLTLAPNAPGAAALIRAAVRSGVTVSLGHHMASRQELEAAERAGATLCTHLGNGIPNDIPRHENPLWWQLACDRLTAMLITDGHHIPADFITVAVRAKGPKRIIITSDASPIAGMPAGRYPSPDGRVMILRETGRVENPATQSLAGSSATMIDCLNHLATLELFTTVELCQVARNNPLHALGFRPSRLRGLNAPRVLFKRGRFVVAKSLSR